MSSLIESTARKAKGSLTGVVDPAGQSAAQSARGNELMKNLAVGGLALGGGAGAVVALVNYLKSLRQENELEDESRLNDDTLYVPALGKKAGEELEKDADVNKWLAPGLGITGGIISSAGAYALTQAIYNHLQKKRRQKMLDEAQGEALDAAELEVAKAAADLEKEAAKMNFYDLVTAFPVAVPMLAALASGGVAYAALKKTFPTVKKTKSKYPKRIRQVSAGGAVEEYDKEGEVLKAASAADFAAERDIEDAAHEFLALIVDQMAQEKSASVCLTSDLLNRVAKDGVAPLALLQKEAGLEAVVEALKGASDEPADLPNKTLAAVAICKSARLRPVLTSLAAAEFQELAPGMMETAISYGEEQLEKFAGIAPLMHLSYFRPQMLDKSAAANSLIEELQELANPDLNSMQEALTSDATGGMADEAEGEDLGIGEEHGSELGGAEQDPVDIFMAQEGEKSPILKPGTVEEEEENPQPAVAGLV